MSGNSGSKEGQDAFVLHLIPTPGYYLDIGANDPVIYSNTWRLREAGWNGACFDRNAPETKIDNYHVCDVTTANMSQLIGRVDHVDYISFDVDSSSKRALLNFPFEEYPFSIMTFEHDLYRKDGVEKKQACKDRLKCGNYTILYENIMTRDVKFEDWWINLDRFRDDILDFSMADISWQQALENIKNYKITSQAQS